MPRPLKIFHINMHHHWGGQPNRVLTESLGLRELGHSVTVAGPRGCMLVERARAAGLNTFEDLELLRGFHPRSFRRDYLALRTLFRREQFDIVHPHGSQDAWLTMWAARATHPRPILVRTRHNTFPVAGHALNRWHYKQFAHVITISPQVNALVSGPTGYPENQITAIYSAPDPDRFYPHAPNDPHISKLRAEFNIPPNAPVIGKVGRLAPEKGHHLFLQAAAEVIKEFPTARFISVGKGRSRTDLEALCTKLGIVQNVIFTGFRTDVPEVVALFDIFCLTPISGESLGTSILEAFCMEKPVIATQVGGTGESVRTGQTGILIPPAPEPTQVHQIAQAIIQLLRNPDLRHQLGKTGRQMVLTEFSPRGLAEKCAAIYQNLMVARQ